MSDEIAVEAVSQPAPEQEATAAPAPVVEAQPEEGKTVEAPKTFTQEELDAAIGKRLAREQRKWEREQAQRMQEAQQNSAQQPASDLKPEQFDTVEAYADALAERKAVEKIAAQERSRQQSEALAIYHEKEEEARGKYDDFEQVAYNPRLSITDVMAQTIQSSDIGPDVAYYLGSNPAEASRIARLSPFLQAKEIGRIEAKLAAQPPAAKQVSKAPAPISPVTPMGSGVPTYDLDDPRSYKQLGPAAWLEARKAKAIKDARAGRT